MHRVIVMLSLLTAISLLAAQAAAAEQEVVLVPIWDASGLNYVYIANERYVVATSETATGSAITYSEITNTFASIADIVVIDLKTGKTVSQMAFSNKIVLFRVSDDGQIHVVAEVNVATDPRTGNVYALPTGFVHMSRVAPYAVGLYDFNGNLIKSYTLQDLINYSVNVTGLPPSSTAFVDGMVISPSGKYIVINGQFVWTGYGSAEIFIFDRDLDIVAYIPANETKNTDQDVKFFVDDEYLITASNGLSGSYVGTGNNITVVDVSTGSVVWRGQGTPVVEASAPVYSAGFATPDGEYVFLYKQVNSATASARLEVWKFSSGYMSLVETINVTHSYTTDLVQPISGVGVYTEGNLAWIPFPPGIVIYNTTSKQYTIVGFDQNKTYSGRLAAVSPQAKYAILGDKAYLIVKQDIQAKEPRVRFHGTAVFNYGEKPVDLSKPVILEAPENKPYHVYFESGSVKITSLVGEERPVDLITDQDVRYGYLGKMLDKGLIGYDVIYQDGGEVRDHSLYKVDDRTVAYYRVHVLKNLVYSKIIGGQASVVDSGIVIRIPLQGTVSTYTQLIQKQSLAVATVAPVFNWKKELLGVFGLEFLAGGASEGIGKALLSESFSDLMKRRGFDVLTSEVDALHLKALKAGRILGRAATIVGIALMVDSAVSAYTHYIDYSSVKTTMFVVPVVEDTRTHDKYAAVAFVLPESEISNRASEYTNYVKTWLKDKLGVTDVGVTFIGWGANWDEYKARLEAGQLPTINLEELITTQIAAAHNIPASRLKFKEVAIVIDTISSGYASFFDWVAGGVEIPIETRVAGQGIQVKGVIPSFVTTNPDEIVTLIPSVEVNGVRYNLTPTTDGAVVHFTLPLGTKKLVIRFPNSPYLATMRVDTSTLVKAPFVNETYGVMRAEFHYDWNNVLIKLDRIEFVDMPYPMKYAERTFRYKYGEFTHDVTPAFELNKTESDPTSPTGVRYYYVTQKNTKFIDPANGGTMQPCKTYIFRYFYIDPKDVGNAWVRVFFNGTTVTSTIPRHAALYIGSNGTSQTISGTLTVSTKYRDPATKKVVTVMSQTFDWSKHVPANESILVEYDIEKFVAKAQELLSEGKVGFVEVVAKITSAEVNYIKDDDEDRVIYYPPPTLPKYGTPVSLSVRVLDYFNQTPISGATVVIDGVDTFTTDANGWANTSVTTGLHTINVTAAGYYDYSEDVNVYDNMTFTVYLIPESATVLPPTGNETDLPAIVVNGTTYYPVAVLVQYQDGKPYDGASVTILNSTTKAVIFTGVTDGSGYAYFPIPANYTIDVEVTAGNFSANQTNITVKDSTLVVFTVNQTSNYFAPEVAISDVRIVIHRGQGWFYGNVSHFVMTYIWTNTPQTIDLYLRLFDTQNNTVSEKTITGIQLHEGVNVYLDWLDVNVSTEFKNVTIYAKIVNFQQDTNLSNNELIGNTVTLKPFLDMYATVIWKPVKQKVSYAILPEDVIEVDIGFVIPAKITGVHIKAQIDEFDVNKKEMKTIEGRDETVATFEPTTIWRNFTVKVPFTNKLVITANVSHPLEDFVLNNNISLEILVDPDTKVEYANPATLVVSSGSPTAVTVKLSSNALGRVFVVAVMDETTKNLLGKKDVEITEPNMTVTISATAPKISGFSEVHEWNVSANGIDYYEPNNYYSFNVTIWGIPWWAILLGILLVILFLLATLRAILATIEDRTRPRFRYFKRLDGDEVSSRHLMCSDEAGIGRFRFFRKL